MLAQDDATSPIGKSWKNTYRVENATQVEQFLTQSRMSWESGAGATSVSVTPCLPAVRLEPRSGAYVFANPSSPRARGGRTRATNRRAP